MQNAHTLSPFRPSVRLSHMSKTVKDRNVQLSPQSRPMTLLVSLRLTSPRNSKGNIESGGAEWESGSKHRPFSVNKSPYLRNGARLLWTFKWRKNAISIGTKVNDLGWPWTAIIFFQIFSKFCVSSHFWKTTTAKRQIALSVTELMRTESTLKRYRLRWYCWAFLG